MDDFGGIRVSDADRETIVARLSNATAEGRLTLGEFSYRADRAYAARTWPELTRLIRDLPAPSRPPMTPPARRQRSPLPLLALLAGAVSLTTVSCMPLGAVLGAAGFFLGVLGLSVPAHGHPGSRGMAIGGLACGALSVTLQLAMFLVLGPAGLMF